MLDCCYTLSLSLSAILLVGRSKAPAAIKLRFVLMNQVIGYTILDSWGFQRYQYYQTALHAPTSRI